MTPIPMYFQNHFMSNTLIKNENYINIMIKLTDFNIR